MKLSLQCDSRFLPGIKELEKWFSFSLAEDGYRVIAKQSNEVGITVISNSQQTEIRYEKPAEFFRAFSLALQIAKTNRTLHVESLFERMGTMQDCSDGVMSVEGIKEVIRLSAVLGYSYLGLYCETTYPVSGEPYFGYQSGRYTREELQEIVAYGALFQIEIVPYIQTLGHMGQLLKWGAYAPLRDIDNVILAGVEDTYRLLDKMLASLHEIFPATHINLGMDEAYFLGLGRYRWFVKEGESDRVSLFLQHARRTYELALHHGFIDPEIWCDTLFEMAFKGYIYPPKEIYHPFSSEVKSLCPPLTFRMWNYDVFSSEEFHRCYQIIHDFTPQISFAGVVSGYSSFAPLNRRSMQMLPAIVNGCSSCGIKDLLITRWESLFSPMAAIPTYLRAAESSARTSGYSEEERCQFLFGYSLSELLMLDLPNLPGEKETFPVKEVNPAYYLLADDLLLGTMTPHTPENSGSYYASLAKRLSELATRQKACSRLFIWESVLCETLSLKAPLGLAIQNSYRKNDIAGIRECINRIPVLVKQIQKLHQAYREYWNSYNKREGFELFDLRFGGMEKRCEVVQGILEDFAEGRTTTIPELEGERLPLSSTKDSPLLANKDWLGIAVGRKMRF